MLSSQRVTWLVALGVFLVVATVYMIVLTPTVPFWDAGEFIACSYILGIPHPPGTPFYVLLGRVATLIPWATVAQRVNALSALPSAVTVMVTYLTGVKLIRLALGKERSTSDDWLVHVGAVTGALMLAFSDAFWENSIEAEVYSLMSLAQIIVLWLGMRWWEEHEREPTSGPLLIAVYVMWLCVGLHLGVGIMGLPLMVLAFLIDRKVAIVFMMPLLTVLLVTRGLESLVGGVLVGLTVNFLILAAQKKLDSRVAWISAAFAAYGTWIAFGDKDFTAGTALIAAASVIVPLTLLALRAREGRILALALGLMVIGYSTHAYLPIRAAQHPAINEGNPSTWESMRDLLERKQYGQMNMFVRRAPLSVQLDKEFWRYFRRQWPLFPTDRLWGALLPLGLGIAGAVWLFRRQRVAFLYTGCFFGLTTAGMIVFLNFSPNEVRDRDYFFQSGYHAYALWIGLGVTWLITWVRESFSEGGLKRWATITAAVVLAAQPALLCKNLWFTHDRRGNYVAEDYAYNMLAPLAPNSYVFTNGDNDTFPLWYIQQVEGVRKDVRVVNLSLLNTDWYIQQLRDDEPKVPISLDNATIKMLGMGAVRDSAGHIIYTNEYMVGHIVSESQKGSGWSKQPYFAVTVPEHMGLEPYFSLEGLVYRVNRDSLHDQIDVPRTEKSLYETFRYRGLFTANGTWDSTVYKDENAATLSRNYSAAHIQLAFWYRRRGNVDRAISEMERVERMFPDLAEFLVPLGTLYLDKGDTAKAIGLFQRIVARNPRNPEGHYYLGATLVYQRRTGDAVREFETAMQLDPDYPQPFFGAYYALWESGQQERALTYLERWANAHPDDAQARDLLDAQRRALGTGENRPALPPPPKPNLP